jgi:hypothetical protein
MTDTQPTAPLPSIAYIDEEADARDDFTTDAFQSGLFETIHALAPEPDLEVMVNTLLELRIDAIVSDFRLTEAGPVGYTGEELVNAFLEKRADFPCFIQTSVDDLALKAADDVNRVYSKNPNADTGGREMFFRRIVLQIERHHTRLAEWREELEKLLAIDREKLSEADIDRIVELDQSVEEHFGLDGAVSRRTKRNILSDAKLMEREDVLIAETEKLIAAMRGALE